RLRQWKSREMRAARFSSAVAEAKRAGPAEEWPMYTERVELQKEALAEFLAGSNRNPLLQLCSRDSKKSAVRCVKSFSYRNTYYITIDLSRIASHGIPISLQVMQFCYA